VAPVDVASTSAVLLPAAAHGSAAGWNSTKAFITERSGVSVGMSELGLPWSHTGVYLLRM
jgi:hypothetical protein